jgi:hypothetical protein
VNIQLIGIIGGLVLGVSWTGAIAAYLFFTRSFRRARNQHTIRLGPLLAGALAIGSFLLLSRLWEQIGLVVHSSPYYMSLYTFVLSSACVMFFAFRGEIRWRKSSGLDLTSTFPDKTQRPPITPAGRRKLVFLLVLGLVSLGFAVGYLARWPRPVSLFLGAASWLFLFAILVLLTTARDRTHALQLQRFLLVAFASIEVGMLALFWKFRDTSPAFSYAALIAAVMLCIGVTAALLVMRRIMPRT